MTSHLTSQPGAGTERPSRPTADANCWHPIVH